MKAFVTVYKFSPYSIKEISQIILNKAKVFNVTFEEEPLKYVAQKAQGNPAEAISLLNKVAKHAEISGVKIITKVEIIDSVL